MIDDPEETIAALVTESAERLRKSIGRVIAKQQRSHGREIDRLIGKTIGQRLASMTDNSFFHEMESGGQKLERRLALFAWPFKAAMLARLLSDPKVVRDSVADIVEVDQHHEDRDRTAASMRALAAAIVAIADKVEKGRRR